MAPRSLSLSRRATRPWSLKDVGTSNQQPGAESPATFGAMRYPPHRARRGVTLRRNPRYLFSRNLVRSSPRQRPMTLLIGIDYAEINKGSQGTNGLVPRGRVLPGVLTGTSSLVLRSSRGPYWQPRPGRGRDCGGYHFPSEATPIKPRRPVRRARRAAKHSTSHTTASTVIENQPATGRRSMTLSRYGRAGDRG
jgi:hypothetical protein